MKRQAKTDWEDLLLLIGESLPLGSVLFAGHIPLFFVISPFQ